MNVVLALILAAATATTPQRPYIGMAMLLRDAPGGGKFLYVAAVAEKTPAAQAGALAGDVINAINGKPITFRDDVDLLDFVGALHPGDLVKLTIVREGKTRELRLKVGVMPPEYVERWELSRQRAREARARRQAHPR